MSDDKKSEVNNYGMSAFGLLGVVFVTLKLCGIQPVADWSWWWVTAPFWGGWALVIGILLLMGLGIGVITIIVNWMDDGERSKRRR